jgi:hypothetical protein
MDLDILKGSVLFNISLQSKELFHSNFLEYIFRRYPDIFFFFFFEKQTKISEIKREAKNTDILILGDKNYIIENKIKDVAKIDQLDRIYNKFESIDGYYLFSLLGNNIHTKGCIWKEIGYSKIVTVLKNYDFKDKYISLIVDDYCNFLEVIIKSFSIYNKCTNYNFFSSKNKLYNQFKEIRMHDLFLKNGMSIFIQYFNANYNKDNKIKTDYSINNTRPTMDFLKKVKGLNVLIQIEDLEYRHAVVCKENQLKYFEKNGWFNQKWTSKRGLNYRSYKDRNGRKFYYQFELIEPNEKFSNLSKKIISDLNNI